MPRIWGELEFNRTPAEAWDYIEEQLIMDTATQTTIDRSGEFDQTKRHVHDPSVRCCADDDGPLRETSGQPTDVFSRPQPSVITEHRRQKLEQDLRMAMSDLEKANAENFILRQRIAGFERMARSLAEHIDGMDAQFKRLTGKTPTEFVGVPGPQKACIGLAAPSVSCVLVDGHTGPCMTGAAA